VLTRFETVDASGRPVSTTDYGSLYRGVECEGAPGAAVATPTRAASTGARPAADWSEQVAIAPALAHVYTECARIWNPIHTDRAVARAAGLPDIILHGTATLALAVSCALRREPRGAASRVTRVACRFGAMVLLPSQVEVTAWRVAATGADHAIAFEARDAEGRAVLRDGRIEIATSPDPEERTR
jgi:acyl dehydratase